MLFIKETDKSNARKHLENVSFTYKTVRAGDYLYAIDDARNVADKSRFLTYNTDKYLHDEFKKVLNNFREPSHFLCMLDEEIKVETNLKIRLLFEKTYRYDSGDGYDTDEVEYAYEDNERVYNMEDIKYERRYFLEGKTDRGRSLMDIWAWYVIVAHKPINGAPVIDELPLMRKAHDEYDFDSIVSYTSGTFLATEFEEDGYGNYRLCPSFEHGKYNVIKKD